MSFLSVPILIIADYWIQRLLNVAMNSAAEGEAVVEEYSVGEDATIIQTPNDRLDRLTGLNQYRSLIKRGSRILLLAVFAFGILRLWGIDIQLGRVLTRAVLSILVTVLFAYVVWEFAKGAIDRKLRESIPDTDEDAEEGGCGRFQGRHLIDTIAKIRLSGTILNGCNDYSCSYRS